MQYEFTHKHDLGFCIIQTPLNILLDIPAALGYHSIFQVDRSLIRLFFFFASLYCSIHALANMLHYPGEQEYIAEHLKVS